MAQASELEGSFDEVSRSLKAVVRSSQHLGENTLEFVSRELAMAVKLSEQIRDEVFSAELLEEARQNSVAASFRASAHRAVDVAADVGSVAYVLALHAAGALAGKRAKTQLPTTP
jgi:hypothetical protein